MFWYNYLKIKIFIHLFLSIDKCYLFNAKPSSHYILYIALDNFQVPLDSLREITLLHSIVKNTH